MSSQPTNPVNFRTTRRSSVERSAERLRQVAQDNAHHQQLALEDRLAAVETRLPSLEQRVNSIGDAVARSAGPADLPVDQWLNVNWVSVKAS